MKDPSASLVKIIIVGLAVLIALLCIFLGYYYVIPALAGTLRFLTPVVLPFALAYVLAELIDPLVELLENRYKLSRGLAVFIVLFFLLGGLTGGLGWIIVRLSIELADLDKYLPLLSNNLTGYILELFNSIFDFYFSLGLDYNVSQQIINNMTANAQKLINQLTVLMGQILTESFYLLSLIPQVLLITFFTLIATFFLARDKDKIIRKVGSTLPNRAGKAFELIVKEIGSGVVGFIRAQFILMLITFFQTLLGLYFLGNDFALLYSLVVAIVDALPILGPGSIFIPWILFEFLNRNLRMAIGLIILYIFITVTRQILQPKIVGENVGIHPLEALLSMYLGLKLFGVFGVFIGPILLVIIKAFWQGYKKTC